MGLPDPYQDLHLYVDFQREAVMLDLERLPLTRKEYALLALLVQHAGNSVSRETLLMRVWGYGSGVRTRTLDVHIRRLRKKLSQYAERYIETIFGIGYRFQPLRVDGRMFPARDFCENGEFSCDGESPRRAASAVS